MRPSRTAIVVLFVSLVALATPAADAARTERHSGSVLTIDPQSGVMVVEEVGPWRVERGETVVTPRMIALTAATQFNLFMRADVPGAFAGDFIEIALEPVDVSPGDFVTAECVSEGGKLVAVTVTVAELGEE
jgi:hypothetical protein